MPLPGDLPFIGMLVAQMFRKPLLARYGSSWSINGETTLMNRLTKRWMRLAAGGRNVMLATGEEESPPAPGMHWIFASAIRASEIRICSRISIAAWAGRRGSHMPAGCRRKKACMCCCRRSHNSSPGTWRRSC